MKNAGVLILLLLLTIGVSACRTGGNDDATAPSSAEHSDASRAPVDDPGPYDDVSWGDWEGVYTEVRPATDADVEAVRTRVEARNSTSWTAEWDELGMTLSISPQHVRAAMGQAEWHFEPGAEPMKSSYVICVDEDGCLRIGTDATADGPHLTNNYLDSMTFLIQGMLLAQRRGEELALEDPMAFAVVDTPIGPLDCLVQGPREKLDALEGASVLLETDPLEAALAPFCVDPRGLVTLTDDLFTPAVFYSSWREGVAENHDAYPSPLRDYNETADEQSEDR